MSSQKRKLEQKEGKDNEEKQVISNKRMRMDRLVEAIRLQNERILKESKESKKSSPPSSINHKVESILLSCDECKMESKHVGRYSCCVCSHEQKLCDTCALVCDHCQNAICRHGFCLQNHQCGKDQALPSSSDTDIENEDDDDVNINIPEKLDSTIVIYGSRLAGMMPHASSSSSLLSSTSSSSSSSSSSLLSSSLSLESKTKSLSELHILVSGYRRFNDKHRFESEMESHLPFKDVDENAHIHWYMGDAHGLDHLAFKYALHQRKTRKPAQTIEIHQFEADWKRFGKKAGPLRNERMVDSFVAATKIKSPNQQAFALFFPDRAHSIGTFHCIRYAQQCGVDVDVIYI